MPSLSPRTFLRFALTTLLLLAPAAGAGQGTASVPAIDGRTRAEVVDSVSSQLARLYVDADTARAAAALLRAKLHAGAYDSLTSPLAFAEAVTRDMRSVNGDLHLSLRYDPASLRRPAETPGAAAPVRRAPGRVAAPWEAEYTRQNYGLGKVEILPGNVGYLEITGFLGAPGFERVVADALRFLERTDAVIIDVRRNGGGSGEMSHFVLSHFLGATPVPTIDIVNRGSGERHRETSLARVPGPRRPAVPLYVLTSRNTGSAAEEFSFVLKMLGRSTLVGERTAGAGHVVGAFDAGNGFVSGISIARVTDPRTGREWERIGVQPDVRVAPERALDVAQEDALKTVAARTTDIDSRRALELIAEVVRARARGERADPARLARLAGVYEGERTVELSDGGLLRYRRRGGGMPEELVPLDGERFALGPARVTFDESGGVPRMTIERPDGARSSYARVGAESAGVR